MMLPRALPASKRIFTTPCRSAGQHLLIHGNRASLFLRFSRCFVLLVLYCPFLHHILKPQEKRSPSAYATASKCVEAAIETIWVAEIMHTQGTLHEAYALTVDVIAMAATTLMVVELGASRDELTSRVMSSSKKAKYILELLALQNCAAARCLESLAVSNPVHLDIHTARIPMASIYPV